MVSWLIEAVATGRLKGITIAAGVFMSGGSMECYNEPGTGTCAGCNTADYLADNNAIGCSSTYALRNLSAPYCQLCCPQNMTEPYYLNHSYRTHPPTFLTQTTMDYGADSCAARNYHETMLANGGKSELAIVPLDQQRCYSLGNPGDPTVPTEAAQLSRFCAAPNMSSINHTQAFSGMVLPLVRFLLDAVR